MSGNLSIMAPGEVPRPGSDQARRSRDVCLIVYIRLSRIIDSIAWENASNEVYPMRRSFIYAMRLMQSNFDKINQTQQMRNSPLSTIDMWNKLRYLVQTLASWGVAVEVRPSIYTQATWYCKSARDYTPGAHSQ